MMEQIFRVHRIPTEDPQLLTFIAGKYATLRLHALAAAPSSFGTSFSRECDWSLQQWIEVIQAPSRHVFVAVAYPSTFTLEQQTIDKGDFVAMGTLIGPTPRKEFEIPESGGPAYGDDDVETKWHMTMVASRLDHRSKGLAKLLIRTAITHITQHAHTFQPKPIKQTRMRIFIHPDNVIVKKLYAGLGFVDAGLVTYMEAVVANGDPGLLPADGGKAEPEKYLRRAGLCMERTGVVEEDLKVV